MTGSERAVSAALAVFCLALAGGFAAQSSVGAAGVLAVLAGGVVLGVVARRADRAITILAGAVLAVAAGVTVAEADGGAARALVMCFGAGLFGSGALSGSGATMTAVVPSARALDLESFLREVVTAAPNPPRQFDRAALHRLARRVAWPYWIGAAGGLVLLYFMTEAVEVAESDGERWLLAAVVAVAAAITLWFALAPARHARRLERTVERGLLARAAVERVNVVDNAFAAVPSVTIWCEVPHPTGSFTKRSTDAGTDRMHWEQGDRLLVLTDPNRPRVLYWIGPESSHR